jgi:hypothetical protein
VVTTNTRATDSDRNDTCQVLDTALSEGQLSMEEHRQRVSAATKATTLGELQSIVSDLQIHTAQLPTLKSPARWGIRIAVAAVLAVLAAGIAWGVFGNAPSPPKTTPSANGNGPALATPRTSPPQPEQQLLTLGGLTGFLAQMKKQFGDTMGYELLVYNDNAVLTRPDTVDAHETVDWHYGNGGWLNTGTRALPAGTTVGDLGKFNAQEVLGVLRGAPQTLQINDPTSTDLIVDAAKDGSLDLQIHLSNDTKSGSIELAADGTVKRISPAHP